MTAIANNSPALRSFHRFIAAGSAALVLLLTILAVSPQLHADVHGHSHPHDAVPSDEGCVVTLFAAGVTAAPAVLIVAAPPVTHVAPAPDTHVEIFVSPPRYLHQPERGPPLS